MQFGIRQLHKNNYKEWNDFLKTRKGATIFHTIEWKKVLGETFGYKPEYLMVEDSKGSIVGISPAFSVKTLFGRVIVSQPLCEYGGPVVEEGFEGAYKEILDFYRDKLENERMKYVEIRVLPDGENKYKYFDNTGFVKQFKAFGFYIDIKDKDFEKDIWLGLFNNKVRNSIRKGTKSGLEIVEESDIDVYYDLYLKTMARLGTPPYPKTFFMNIKKYAKSLVRFTFAYLGDTPIAGLWTLFYNNRASIVGNVSHSEYLKYNANDLLYNEQIKYATKNKFEIIDLGRTRPDSLYERYKKKWGATKVDLHSYVYPQSASESVNPYKHYLIFSKITKKVPWICTKTGIGPYLAKKFP